MFFSVTHQAETGRVASKAMLCPVQEKNRQDVPILPFVDTSMRSMSVLHDRGYAVGGNGESRR
jgi:hypothetical protein